jgi:hypothetical protein
MEIWRMRIACWVRKATNTHFRKKVIFIAIPLQQRLHKSASLLRHSTFPVQFIYSLFTASFSFRGDAVVVTDVVRMFCVSDRS